MLHPGNDWPVTCVLLFFFFLNPAMITETFILQLAIVALSATAPPRPIGGSLVFILKNTRLHVNGWAALGLFQE